MNRPGPARRWPLVERHRQRSQQTLLAGLIRQPSAGVVATMQLDGFETIVGEARNSRRLMAPAGNGAHVGDCEAPCKI